MDKFDACATCANRDTDPWICRYCRDANNYEPVDADASIQTVSLDEIRNLNYRKVS